MRMVNFHLVKFKLFQKRSTYENKIMTDLDKFEVNVLSKK